MYVSDSLDQLLTAVFMLLAVGAIVLFFVMEDRTLFYWIGGVAVVLRLFQYGRRVLIRKNIRKDNAGSLRDI